MQIHLMKRNVDISRRMGLGSVYGGLFSCSDGDRSPAARECNEPLTCH